MENFICTILNIDFLGFLCMLPKIKYTTLQKFQSFVLSTILVGHNSCHSLLHIFLLLCTHVYCKQTHEQTSYLLSVIAVATSVLFILEDQAGKLMSSRHCLLALTLHLSLLGIPPSYFHVVGCAGAEVSHAPLCITVQEQTFQISTDIPDIHRQVSYSMPK